MSIFMKHATASFEGAEASDDVDNVTFTPTVTTATFNPISGNTRSESTVTWALTMNVAQNMTANSLYMKLLESEGEGVWPMIFKPRGLEEGGATVIANVVPAPGAIGGAVGALVASVTLAVNGKPVIAPATV